MEIIGRLIKQEIIQNSSGSSRYLEKPLYTFMIEDEQPEENFCCEQMKIHLKFVRFTPNENFTLAASITSAYFCMEPKGQPPGHLAFIHNFKYCPACAEPFKPKVVKHTKFVQVRKVETTYQFVEVDDNDTIKIEP